MMGDLIKLHQVISQKYFVLHRPTDPVFKNAKINDLKNGGR